MSEALPKYTRPNVGEMAFGFGNGDKLSGQTVFHVSDTVTQIRDADGNELRFTKPVKQISHMDLRWGHTIFAWVPCAMPWPPAWTHAVWPPPPPGSMVLIPEPNRGGLAFVDDSIGSLILCDDEDGNGMVLWPPVEDEQLDIQDEDIAAWEADSRAGPGQPYEPPRVVGG